MRFFDYLSLAFRNIRRQKMRSSLTIFAVVIGVMSVTIMLALVTGAKGFFLQQVEANGTLQQVAVSQKTDLEDFQRASDGGNCDSCVKLNDDLVSKIEKMNHVEGVTRIAYAHSFQQISYEGKDLTAERIEGHDANGIIQNVVVAGRDFTEQDSEGVVTITTDYADKFGFKGNYDGIIGKDVSLTSQGYYTGVGAEIKQPQMSGQGGLDGSGKPDQAPTVLNAKVIGVVASGDSGAIIGVPLPWVRGMNLNRQYQPDGNACQPNKPCNQSAMTFTLVEQDMLAENGYNSLIAKVDNSKYASEVATQIKTLGVGAADAKASIQSQLTIFNIIGLVLGAIGGIALLVAAIGVVNTMIMAILERTREIGVMRAVGSKRSTVRRLFTIEASMLGFMGGVIGVAFGFGLTRIANVFVNKQLVENSISARNIIGTPPWLVLTVIAIATLIGLLAGLGPAARAARLDPVDALRYE